MYTQTKSAQQNTRTKYTNRFTKFNFARACAEGNDYNVNVLKLLHNILAWGKLERATRESPDILCCQHISDHSIDSAK